MNVVIATRLLCSQRGNTVIKKVSNYSLGMEESQE